MPLPSLTSTLFHFSPLKRSSEADAASAPVSVLHSYPCNADIFAPDELKLPDMDIQLLLYRIHGSPRISHLSTDAIITQQMFYISGCCLLNKRRRRFPFPQVGSSFMENSLSPRPMPKPIKHFEENHYKESKTQVVSSQICVQIEKLVLCKRYVEALEMFDICLIEGGHDVGRSTYSALIDACIKLNSIRGVKRVFDHVVSSAFELDLYMRNRVLLMHVKCGMMLDARSLFDEMPERNLVSWNIIIVGLLDSGYYIEAIRLFLSMWEEFSEAGSRTFALMIRACAALEDIFPGKQLHSCVLKMSLDADAFVSCALIDMYSKCGHIMDAKSVFDKTPEKATAGWNSIIAGYALHGSSQEVMDMYYEMRDSGAKLDKFTFSIIVKACVRLASLELAKQAHAGLVRHGFGSDMVVNTALLDMYSKWGRIEDARNVFEKMPQKNEISWNALIAGYGIHGRGTEAVELFEQMIHEGTKPNHVTFLAVLGACSYSGLSDRGWEIYESMRTEHKVKPRPMHYACMIELLGRKGRLEEAFAFLTEAPLKPTVNMWAALLTACRIHKNFELGKLVGEQIYLMEPKKLSNYLVLLNIYRSCGKQKEANAVFGALMKQGLKILPSSTWIDVKNQQHTFFSGENCHGQMAQTVAIHTNLDKLMVEISKYGYEFKRKSFLPDVDEQEDKMSLYHSEKLAVSFGLISTSCSASIRLVQSHRICDDCHEVIKLITMATGREIVVRDGSRFHRFRDGKCCCGDYW